MIESTSPINFRMILLIKMFERYYLETRKTYDQFAHGIVNSAKSAFHIAYLPKFIKVLQPGGFVVDLGCGSGRDARQFMDHGLAYLGVDYSLKTVELARQNAPYARFEHKDIRTLHFLPETVSAFWAPDVLYHFSKKDFEHFLKQAFDWLASEGQFFIIMKMGSGEGYIKVPGSGGMYHAYYTKDELEVVAKKIGYKIKEAQIHRRETIQADSVKAYGSEDIIVLWLEKPAKH